MTKQCHWINQVGIRCGQPRDHMGAHGNGLLTTGKDTWREMTCIWSGAHGICILPLGHDGPHKEGTTNV